jgi:hypothetical protein
VELHFGFQILLARTEIGGYCSHCQVLRAKEIQQITEQHVGVDPDSRRNRAVRGA